jgi:formyltetrahydrofolate-dependent phosphoribosylglycinamide formyltransferase
MFLRVAVVVSGRGSNLAALLRALGADAPARVILVISNRAEAEGLAVARRQGVPTHVLQDSADPAEWRRVLEDSRAELVVLAGYLKRVPEAVVDAWRGRMINIHPALLPLHGGAGMYGRRVHQAVLASGDVASGATVHLVTGEYDRGPILGQARVPVVAGDTPDTLAERVLALEHRLLPAAVLAAARAGRPVPFTLEKDDDVSRVGVP